MDKNTPHDIIATLQETRLVKDKRDLLDRVWHAGNREFFLGLRAALDPTRDYGAGKVPQWELDGSEAPEELATGAVLWVEFQGVLDQLNSRAVADPDAVVTGLAERAGMLEWNLWYRRILLQDLRCGLTAGMINQVLKKIGRDAAPYRIATLDLPQPEPLSRHRGGLMGRKYLEPRLLGQRVAVLVRPKAKVIRLFDDAGTPLGTPAFLQPLTDLKSLTVDTLLDGWLTGVDFRGHMTTGAAGASHLALTDFVPLDGFRTGYCPTPLRDRNRLLAAIQADLQAASQGTMWVLPKLQVDTTSPGGRRNLQDFREECRWAGYGSLVVKDPEAGYGEKAANWIEIGVDDNLGFVA